MIKLETLRKIAEKTIGFDMSPGVKPMSKEESCEWHRKHARIDKDGHMIISSDEIGRWPHLSIKILKSLCNICVEFFCPNPFQKGYISNEDCKKRLKYISGNYEFYSETIDLHNGLDVIFIKDNYHDSPKISEYSHALADFMMWWERDVRSHLNGFCGFDCVKFRFLVLNI